MFGNVLKEAREKAGFTQTDLSNQVPVSRSTIAMTETGKRDLPHEVVPTVLQKLDCGFLVMEAAAHYTGGAFVTKLNGDAVDLHRSAVKEKTIEELHEALEAIQNDKLANNPQNISPADRERLEKSLLEVIDAIWSLCHYAAVICKEYGFSWSELWKKHRIKLKANGYIK